MYYRAKTGLVFTERDVEKSFEMLFDVPTDGSEKWDIFFTAVTHGKENVSSEPCWVNFVTLIKWKAKVPAIIMYRRLTGKSLAESKEYVEGIINGKSD